MVSNSSIPILPARDLVETRNFYERLGFETVGWWPDIFGGYAILVRGQLEMHFFRYADLSPSDNYGQCYWRVDDVDGFYRAVRSSLRADSNTPQVKEPEDKPWGVREFALGDPNGNLIRIGQIVSR